MKSKDRRQKLQQMADYSDKGFTLLELMISLAIMGLIVVIIFGAFRIGVRAWEKGERDLESHQRQRIVLGLIKRQLASTFLLETWNEDQRHFLLEGDNKSMQFVSQIALAPGNKLGMVYARYAVTPEDTGETERLAFYERNIVLIGKDSDMDDIDEDDFIELIPGVSSIGFEYLKGQTDEEASQWQETWDPEIDDGFPRAVKIVFKEDAETAPICVIAAIGHN